MGMKLDLSVWRQLTFGVISEEGAEVMSAAKTEEVAEG
jgi:hypothetical protein